MDCSHNNSLDKIDWKSVFALDCKYTVDGIHGGRFCLEMASKIAKDDKSVVRDGNKIVEDYRE
jgi:hypothetical protein